MQLWVKVHKDYQIRLSFYEIAPKKVRGMVSMFYFFQTEMDFYSECYLVFELEKALPDPKTDPDQQSLSFAMKTGFYSKNVSVL